MVPTSELADAIKQIRELQRLLCKKTMKAELLKEAVEVAHSRKWTERSILSPGGAISGAGSVTALVSPTI